MKASLLRVAIPTLLAIGTIVTAVRVHGAGLDITRTDVQKFITKMNKDYAYDRQDLVWALGDAELQPRIVEIMEKPAEGTMQWYQYRARFMTDERINGGVAVWQQNSEALAAIERDSGVPAQYLIAITGVETYYGRQTGGYRVLDALTTLAFDYPRRAEFFQGELAQFLLLAREERLNPRTPKGSYAGAMGIPQFMPFELSPLCRGWRPRHASRPVEVRAGCIREHRALLQGERLASGRAGAGRCEERCAAG